MVNQNMTVRDVVSTCDLGVVAEVFYQNDSLRPDNVTEKEKADTVERIRLSLEKFRRDLLSLPAANIPDRYVMFAMRCWDDGRENIASCLYEEKDFLCMAEKAESADPPAISSITKENAESIMDALFAEFPNVSIGYEFMEWEEVLAAKVIPGNAERFGLNRFAADILWNMSFNGMKREDQEKRREDLEKSIREAESIRSLPKEEQEKHYHCYSVEEMFEKFGLTTPTEEEREETRKQMYLDSAKTSAVKVLEFKRIAREEKDYVSGLRNH